MSKNNDFRKQRAEAIKKEIKAPPWAEKSTAADRVSWADIDGLLIAYVVTATVEGGASVQFTLSRDGGSLGVRIYDEAFDTKTEWVRPGEGAEELLFKIADHFRKHIDQEVLRWS